MSDHLPREIVEEILHRLPVKSLVKCTSVCKAWNCLITDQTFISDHLKRTIQSSNGNGSLFLHFCHEKDRWPRHPHKEDFYSLYSVHQQTDHFSVERFPLSHLFRRDRYILFAGTCNGLVCYADYSPLHSANILIWNPLLRKYVMLPKPFMTCNKRDRQHFAKYDLSLGLCFDSNNNDYKVVRLMNLRSEQDTPHVEVYSLVSRSWRSITVKAPQFYFFHHHCEWRPPVFVNGAVHWVVYRREARKLVHRFILSFDVTKETFGRLKLPQQSERGSLSSKLLAVEGGRSLAVVNYRATEDGQLKCNIWVMEKYGIAESWTEIFQCYTRDYGGISSIIAVTSSEKVVTRLTCGAIVLVDPIEKLVEPMGHAYSQAYSQAYAGSYVESLFFINKEHGALSL